MTLNQFCDENNWVSSELLLPANTFTYLSERWDSTSWLDHCVSTSDGHDVIQNMFCTISVHHTTFLLSFPGASAEVGGSPIHECKKNQLGPI